MKDVYTIHEFGPSDILTSDIEHKRRVKVDVAQDPNNEFASPTYNLLSNMAESNRNILIELKLLNARFEEMAETLIEKTDIEE